MWNSDWKKGEDYPTWGDTDVYKKTITGGSTNIGPCRVTYIQAHGGTNCLVKLHDGTGTGGSLQFQAKFSSEGLDIYVPGNGIRFETGVYLDLTTTDSVTIGYTG